MFTVPKPLRLVLAHNPAWTSWIGGLVVRAIGAWQRRVARKRGIRTPLTGAVTFVQRFGGLVNLNVHFHLVVPDGVFVEDGEGLRFEMLHVSTNANVAILDRIMRRIARRLAKDAAVGSVEENAAPDVLAQVQAEAAQHVANTVGRERARPRNRATPRVVRGFLPARGRRDRRARSRRARTTWSLRRATGIRAGALEVDRRCSFQSPRLHRLRRRASRTLSHS